MRKSIAKYLNDRKLNNEQVWEELAEDANIGKTTLLNYSKGKGNPRLDTLELLCKKLGVTPNRLLLGDSFDQFLLESVIPTVCTVAKLPFEKKINFVDLFLQMLQILESDKTPDAPLHEAEIIDKTEELV